MTEHENLRLAVYVVMTGLGLFHEPVVYKFNLIPNQGHFYRTITII